MSRCIHTNNKFIEGLPLLQSIAPITAQTNSNTKE